ncbi:MAG: haloacid dehalogenase family protein [Halonotius sp. J07HN4]|nr:MAG: haloacid dehalogenase family protein [Halonotius sp. J07HN4]
MTDPDERVVLFDMDGVILEGHGTDDAVHDRALDDAIADAGLTVDDDTYALLAGYEYDTEFVRGCDRLGIDPVAFYQQRERHSANRTIDRLAAGHRTLYPDSDALEAVTDDYALGLISNNYDAVVEFVVDHYNLDIFEYSRGRDPGVDGFYRRKPNPHYLLAGREALGGADGVYVGDRATDVVAATRAGLDAVLIRREHNRDASPSVKPAAEIESLTELPSIL